MNEDLKKILTEKTPEINNDLAPRPSRPHPFDGILTPEEMFNMQGWTNGQIQDYLDNKNRKPLPAHLEALLDKDPTNAVMAIEQRVVHFGNAKTGHGLGTIVAYNGTQENRYLKENFKEAVELADKAGLLGGVVNSFYSADRCPYVVQWDNGYKDVYEHSSLSRYDPTNPDHDPGPLMKIRLHRGALDESMETVALIRPTMEGVRWYLRTKGVILDVKMETVVVKPYSECEDHRIGWKQTYLVTFDGAPVGFTDGPIS